MLTNAASKLGKDSPNLDLLRSVAVTAVFIAHLLATFGWHKVWISSLGWSGVVLFFVHTCLVLLLSMERLNMSGWRLFASFYVRRIFRIYPLSICAVLTVAAFHIPPVPWAEFKPISWDVLVSNLMLVQNVLWKPDVIGPLWSLPLELEMYAVLPVLFLLARRWRSSLLGLGLWLLFVPIGYLIPKFHSIQIGGIGIFQYVPCFLGGMVAYQVSRRVLPRRPFWLWPVAIAAFVAAYVGFLSASRGWVECLVLGFLAPSFQDMQSEWLKKLSHTVAQYSYGIYLLHPPLMWLAFIRLQGLPPVLQWAVFAVTMAGGCYLAYHCLEAPLIRVGANISKRFQTPVERVASKELGTGQAAPAEA